MSLDFVPLAASMDDLVSAIRREGVARDLQLSEARWLLQNLPEGEPQGSVGRAQNANWLMALPEEALSMRRTAPDFAGSYATLATDGSSIDVSRHAPAACYLINIGHAWLYYKTGDVDLGNRSALGFGQDRLLRSDRANASKESVMTGNLLDAYRTAQEFLRLAELAEQHPEARPLVALLDGQFVLWGIKESELSSGAQAEIFDEGVLCALDRLRELARGGGLALASYISRPAGKEVTNALRIARCPRDGGADCRDCPRRDDFSRPCDDVAGGTDAQLFADYLGDGRRSAIFRRHPGSSDLVHADRRYEDTGHGLRFFYLRLPEGEVARIEMPEWTAVDPAAVDLVHAIVLDQCARGGGYPLVLQEAHEQAVIDGADRRTFALLIERELDRRGSFTPASGKSWSKRRRQI